MRTLLIFLLVIGAGLLAVGSGTQHFSADVAKDSTGVTPGVAETNEAPANTDVPEIVEPPAALTEAAPLAESTDLPGSPEVAEAPEIPEAPIEETPVAVVPGEAPEGVPEEVSETDSVPDLPASEVLTGAPMEYGNVSAGIPLKGEGVADESASNDRHSSEQVYAASNEAVSILHVIKRTHKR